MNGNELRLPLNRQICYIFLVISFLSFGCGKDEVKPSEDSVLAQNALRSIEKIKEAYQTKNLSPVSDLIDSGMLARLKEELNFNKAALSFSTPRVIKITDSHVTVSVNWQGNWELGSVTRVNRGSSRFVFLKNSMQLAEIEDDNPFSIPINRNGKNQR